MPDSFNRRDISLANWRSAPFSRYSFSHVEEFVPIAHIMTGTTAASTSIGISALEGIDIRYADSEMVGVAEHLKRTHTDALVVLRDGRMIAEWHAPWHAQPALPHIIFSISKSVTGMLAGIAAGEGKLDPDAPVGRYVNVPDHSAYARARVRDLLDMTVALDFTEDYQDRSGLFDRYRRATLWNPNDGAAPEEALHTFLPALGGTGAEHGHSFFYASPNTDMVGQVIEAATGMRYHDYMRERLWMPMEAAGPAWLTVDRAGNPRAAGGICVAPADLARFGDLMLNDGRTRAGAQIVPNAWVSDMRQNGDPAAWKRGNFADRMPDGRYRSCWYTVGDERGSFCGIGIHGQRLWVDPTNGVVIAKLSSQPEASEETMRNRDTTGLAAIARAL